MRIGEWMTRVRTIYCAIACMVKYTRPKRNPNNSSAATVSRTLHNPNNRRPRYDNMATELRFVFFCAPLAETNKKTKIFRAEAKLSCAICLPSIRRCLISRNSYLCLWLEFEIRNCSNICVRTFSFRQKMNIEWTLNISTRMDALRDDNTRNKIFAKQWKRKKRLRKTHRNFSIKHIFFIANSRDFCRLGWGLCVRAFDWTAQYNK